MGGARLVLPSGAEPHYLVLRSDAEHRVSKGWSSLAPPGTSFEAASRRLRTRWLGSYNDSGMAPQAIEITQNRLGDPPTRGCWEGESISRIPDHRPGSSSGGCLGCDEGRSRKPIARSGRLRCGRPWPAPRISPRQCQVRRRPGRPMFRNRDRFQRSRSHGQRVSHNC
jgi:hypothetical protein